MKKKYILVTGGAGYIGACTCRLLQEQGYIPVVYDNLSTGHKYAVKWGPLEKGDITEKKQLEDVFKKYDFYAVVHFAANALVGESMILPCLYYWNNVVGSINLLETMRKFAVRKFIFSSSCATYGIPMFSPITEKHPQNPINPYGRTKLIIEQTLKDYSKCHDIHYVSLRYFNAAGADLQGEIGENHINETHLFPLIFETALKRRKQLQVLGNDFPTTDGSAVRDYIHIVDLAKAHILAIQWLENNTSSLYVNLGTGRGYSVFEIIHAIEEFIGEKISYTIAKKRKGDPSVLIASYQQAQDELQWQPQNSQLTDIIASAWEWHKEYLSSKQQLVKI